MKDNRLLDELGSLEPVRASDDFTGKVMQRLDASPASGRQRPAALGLRPLLAATVVAVGFVLAVAVWRGTGVVENGTTGSASTATETSSPPLGRTMTPERLAGLRAEHQRLQDEMRTLRRLARQSEPVIYLGGNDRVDVVLDLRQVPPGAATLAVQKAAIRGNDRARY